MVTPEIERYAEEYTSAEPPRLAAVADRTRAQTDRAYMLSDNVQAHLLATLIHLGSPQQVLEIGTFTGYATLAMASAMPPGGRLTTCEIDPEHARIAADHFAASPYVDLIDLRVGPALPVVRSMAGPIDFVFIDADKSGYLDYVEAVLPKLAPRGVIAIDNTLHNGFVAGDEEQQGMIDALRAFNLAIRDDRRVDQVVLTVRDGLTLIRARRDQQP
jgi:caffeoyl-CoA O-methyltransferase